MKRRGNQSVNIKNKRINNINKNIVNNNSLLIQKSKNILNKNYTNDKIINSTLNKKRTKSIVITNSKKLKFKNGKLNLKNKVQKNECYNDNELNSLNYDEARQKDKRAFTQYYISLLKMNHILIFSFFSIKDYNSQIIKIYIYFFYFRNQLYDKCNVLF